MSIIHRVAIEAGKLTRFLLRLFGRQASTLPGRVTLALSGEALAEVAGRCHIIAVTGTNGKTTTTALIANIFQAAGCSCHTNRYGANLASGLMTSLLDSKAGDLAVLEVDEAALAQCGAALSAEVLVVTNLSPDQLDRFGSLENIIDLVDRGSRSADKLVLCLDNEGSSSVGNDKPAGSKIFFGSQKGEQRVVTSWSKKEEEGGAGLVLYRRERSLRKDCPSDIRLLLKYSGLAVGSGQLACDFPLPGDYNAANAAAATAAVLALDPAFSPDRIRAGLETVSPQFGRLERIQWEDNRSICLVLIKNEAGFVAAAEMIREQEDVGGLLFVINNKPADGQDISWFAVDKAHEQLPADLPYGAAGLCAEKIHDILLAKLSGRSTDPKVRLGRQDAPVALVESMLADLPAGKTLYVLPNYTAMMTLQPDLLKKSKEHRR